MPRRPETLETLHLTLAMLARIPSVPRKVTARQLHESLQAAGLARDLRTVQRQLKLLAEHFDIVCDDRSRPYGYSWKQRARGFIAPALGEQESLLLTLAEQHLRRLLPQRLMLSMEHFFVQAKRNLDNIGDDGAGKRGRQERDWLQKVRVVSTTQPLLPPPIDPAVFQAVSNALYADTWLDFSYRNRAGVLRESQLMPLGLAQQGELLYLVGRFKGYDNERSLALHRFVSARDTGLHFPRPADFNLARYDADGRFGFGDGRQISLSFRINRDAGLHLRESSLSADQVLVEEPECYHITATVVDSGQLDWWLRGFGDEVWDIYKQKLDDVG